jgi:hypothetical protein
MFSFLALLVAAHPDYLGSALMLLGAGVALLGGDGPWPADAARVLFVWLALYAASAFAEEAYSCPGPARTQPLRPGASPFWDYLTREPVRQRCDALALVRHARDDLR